MTTGLANSRLPKCPDGDVQIVLKSDGERTVMLNSSSLNIGSEYFRLGMSERWVENKIDTPPQMTAKGVRIKHYELEFDKLAGMYFITGKERPRTTFEPISLGELNKHVKSAHYISLREAILAHEIILAVACFQSENLPINFNSGVIRCLALVWDFYGMDQACATILSHHIVHGIPGFTDMVASTPCVCLRLACRLKSVPIYQEALKHTVGQSFTISLPDLHELDQDRSLKTKVENEKASLELLLSQVELNLRDIEADPEEDAQAFSPAKFAEIVWVHGMRGLDRHGKLSFFGELYMGRCVTNTFNIRWVATQTGSNLGTGSGFYEVVESHLKDIFWAARTILSKQLFWDKTIGIGGERFQSGTCMYPTCIDFSRHQYPWNTYSG